jgi:hypothetical protein
VVAVDRIIILEQEFLVDLGVVEVLILMDPQELEHQDKEILVEMVLDFLEVQVDHQILVLAAAVALEVLELMELLLLQVQEEMD